MIGDPYTFFSSAKDTRQRTHHVKKLHGMLPTMNTMHARHPDLYPDSVCRVCNVQDEDNNHVWLCHEIGEEHAKIWEEALTCIDGWGKAVTRSYNKERQRQYERDLRNGKPHAKKPTPVPWICPARKDHCEGLSSIGGTRSLLLGEGTFDRSPDLQWSMAALYRGITPRSLIAEWSEYFQSPRTIARCVIHKFVGYLESQATERIWKQRCTKTIAWERAMGITGRLKKAKYAGPRGPWNEGSGYICSEGECPCGSPFNVHIDNQCPGAQLNPHVADATLLQCLQGRRKMGTMEGMGRTPYF